jgi:hypothetical protein
MTADLTKKELRAIIRFAMRNKAILGKPTRDAINILENEARRQIEAERAVLGG